MFDWPEAERDRAIICGSDPMQRRVRDAWDRVFNYATALALEYKPEMEPGERADRVGNAYLALFGDGHYRMEGTLCARDAQGNYRIRDVGAHVRERVRAYLDAPDPDRTPESQEPFQREEDRAIPRVLAWLGDSPGRMELLRYVRPDLTQDRVLSARQLAAKVEREAEAVRSELADLLGRLLDRPLPRPWTEENDELLARHLHRTLVGLDRGAWNTVLGDAFNVREAIRRDVTSTVEVDLRLDGHPTVRTHWLHNWSRTGLCLEVEASEEELNEGDLVTVVVRVPQGALPQRAARVVYDHRVRGHREVGVDLMESWLTADEQILLAPL